MSTSGAVGWRRRTWIEPPGELTNRLQVVDIALSGDMDPLARKRLAERVCDELTAIPWDHAGRHGERAALRSRSRSPRMLCGGTG